MTYTNTTVDKLRAKPGTLDEKLASEFAAIKAEYDSVTGTNTSNINKAKIKIIDLTASMVSSTGLAANGVDVAVDTGVATYYTVFVAPVDCTLISMDCWFTEAYVKATGDASIVLQTDAGAPVVKVTYNLAAGGVALRAMVSTNPSSVSCAAGTALDLVVTPTTAAGGGTGHCKVFLRYSVN